MKQFVAGNDPRVHNAVIPDPGKGKHLWAMMVVYQLANPELSLRGEIHLDNENLIAIEGPGCFKCEEVYSDFIARRFCQGSMY